ncbi:TAFII28 protein, partial [Rhizoctonia solani]
MMNAQKRKATNIDDIDVDAELEAGPSTNPYLKRGRTGTVEAGSRAGSMAPNAVGADGGGGEGDDDDEEAPAMADDDYSAQLSWQSQSKENMKLLLSSFTPDQLARYETYRRSTLNKQSVRRFIHQSLGANVSVNVAQVIAGFSKVFVGEIIELARQVQQQSLPPGAVPGPLTPDHLRAAYQLYIQQTGHVGSAKPARGRRFLPSELQLCIIGHLSTRRLLRQVTRLSKHWHTLVCKLIRQRALRLLGRPGLGLVFETSTPSHFDSKSYTLIPHRSGPFDESTCAVFPQLAFSFASSAATFEFSLDEDEYFGSFLWSVSLSTSRSIQCRVSPPASPKLLAFDRTVRQNHTVQNGLDRLRRCEFPAEGGKARSEERELTGDHGSAISLKTQLLPALPGGNFKTLMESIRMDASSLLVAHEDTQRSNDLMVFFCR